MMKKILLVDDSALMRRVICDIISEDGRYEVDDVARDGLDAYDLLKKKNYDLMVLDINMPRMTGLELLEKLNEENIRITVIVASSLTTEGAHETMRALELGAFEFVTKPGNFIEARGASFHDALLKALGTAYKVCGSEKSVVTSHVKPQVKPVTSVKRLPDSGTGVKIVALACSTGGPRSLQSVIPFLPENLDAAVLLVQHMPAGFTATLAERLDGMSSIRVKEAEDGEPIEKGCVYIAPGGKHLRCVSSGKCNVIRISDEPPRDALKPSANLMYESLEDSAYREIVCVVLTGMGSDGTQGIVELKNKKKLYVIAQDAQSSVVYGMPKSIFEAGVVDEVVGLDAIAEAITRNVGVH